VEWPARRCYVGLVAVGVQEQAEDILVPPLLQNCLTLITFLFPSHYLPSKTVVLQQLYCLSYSKNVYDDDDDDDDVEFHIVLPVGPTGDRHLPNPLDTPLQREPGYVLLEHSHYSNPSVSVTLRVSL